jgi:hypothetical protein
MSDGKDHREMKRTILDIQKRREDNIRGSQQNAEDVESEQNDLNNRVEGDLKDNRKEIEDAEQRQNTDELDDAVENEEGIEQILGKQEELTEQAIQELENQLEFYLKEDEEIENIEKDILESLKSIKSDLSDTIGDLNLNGRSANRDIISSDIEQLEQDLELIRDDAKFFQKLMEEQEEKLEFFEKTEREQLKLENSMREIRKKLEMTEKEVKELLLDTEELRDKRGYQEAEAEEKELEELIQEWKKERSRENKTNQMIEKEIQESELIISEDGEIIAEMEDILQLLDRAEDVLTQNQTALKPLTTAKMYKTILSDLNKTKKELKTAIQRERNTLDQLSDTASDVANAANKILEEASTDDEGNKTNLGTSLEWLLGIILATAIVLWALGQFGVIGAAGALSVVVVVYWIFFD